jgi:CRISPR-associated protein Csb1
VSTQSLTIEILTRAIEDGAAAFRCRRKLQPAGGPGDKVFPPTFAGAVYAVEQRRIFGDDGKPLPQPVTCVVLDTVQSEANRMEQALQDALDAKRIKIPVIKVDSSNWSPTGDVDADKTAGRLIDAVGNITSLQVPHRCSAAKRARSLPTAGFRWSSTRRWSALRCRARIAGKRFG